MVPLTLSSPINQLSETSNPTTRSTMDDIITKLHELAISNLSTTPPTAASMEAVERALDNLTLNDHVLPSPLAPAPTPDFSSCSSAELRRLSLLDERLDSHIKSILLCLDKLASPDPSSQSWVEVDLHEEKRWLEESIRQLHELTCHQDADIRLLTEAMRDRMLHFASAIDFYIETLHRRSPPQSSAHVVNTGNTFLLVNSSKGSVNCYHQSIILHPTCVANTAHHL